MGLNYDLILFHANDRNEVDAVARVPKMRMTPFFNSGRGRRAQKQPVKGRSRLNGTCLPPPLSYPCPQFHPLQGDNHELGSNLACWGNFGGQVKGND